MKQEDRHEFAKAQLERLERYNENIDDIYCGEVSFEYERDGEFYTGEFYVRKDEIKRLLRKELSAYRMLVKTTKVQRKG